jgi:subtilisin family serine protease
MHLASNKRRAVGCLASAAIALAVVGAAIGADGDRAPGEAWRTAFETRPDIDLGGRMVVVLAAPSLADRMKAHGVLPSPKAQRRFVRQADVFQRRLLAALRRQGVKIERERVYTRTFNGFSAILDARALAALERAPGVAGVYPVRAVYPASVTGDVLERPEFGPGGGRRPGISLAGADGRGVTIALLDTGVDRNHRALHDRVLPGVDLVDGRGGAGQPEAHGTRMAGLLVGSDPLGGVAPGATIFPIRVLAPALGDGALGFAGRSDVLLAGLERAVDPDNDGAVDDAARIALAPLVEPYAAFADSPEARSVAGAVRLGTLVVAPVGNDGPSGGGFGTVGAPGGVPAALGVGAIDTRAETLTVEVRLSAGGEELWSGTARLLGPVAPAGPSDVGRTRLAVLPANGTPLAPRLRAIASGEVDAVVVYGSGLPAGGVDLDSRAALPVVAVPLEAGQRLADAVERGWDASLSLGEVSSSPNPAASGVAAFSSQGPAVGGHAKPDLVAPGVGLATADASRGGGAAYATVTGSSAAAAAVAGAAALVSEARPSLDASELAGVLVGSARPLGSAGILEPVAAQGAGLVDPAGAARAELAAAPAHVTLGPLTAKVSTAEATVSIANVSSRLLRVRLSLEGSEGPAGSPTLDPQRLVLRPGERRDVAVSVHASGGGAGAGTIVARARGIVVGRIPWIISRAPARVRLVRAVELSARVFRASDRAPALLSFQAGRADASLAGLSVTPVALLEVELLNARGERLGVLARLRDLLPGRYSLGLTGRAPAGTKLAPGRYVVRLKARSADSAEGVAAFTSTVSIGFRIAAP